MLYANNKKEEVRFPKEEMLKNLEKGLEAEYASLKLCGKLINALDDEVVKAKIEEKPAGKKYYKKLKNLTSTIIEDEKRHVEIVEGLIEKIKQHYVDS